MLFQGNIVDLLILLILFIWIVDAWDEGFFILVADLIAFLGAFVFALRFYPRSAELFSQLFLLSRGIANVIGFLFVYLLSHATLTVVLVGALKELPTKKLSRLWRNLLGLFPSLINGLIVSAVLLTLATSLPLRPEVKQTIFESRIGGFLVRRTGTLERQLDAVFGEAIQETLSFLTVEPKGTERIKLGFEVTKPSLRIDEKTELAMFGLVNREREERGVKALLWDPAIVGVARAHATDMFERGYFSHVSPEGKDVGNRLREAGLMYLVAGENLALAPTLEMAHEGLMQSEGHRRNILDPEFQRIGIGVIDGGTYGKMFVQVFAD